MRFSFKKALATVLSIALVLSTCVCALTVGAATPAGSIDIPDAEVELVDGKFTTTATINLVQGYKLFHVAYQLELPENVTFVDAKSTAVGATASYIPEKDLVFVAFDDPELEVQTIPVEMTFATELLSGSFEIGIGSAYVAEITEADLTLDIADTGAITIGHDCVAGEPQIENNVDPTCTTAGGYDTVIRCTVCNEIISSVHTDVDALGHDYDEGVVTTEPKCEEAGVKTYTCGVCGDTKTEAISATGHTAGAEVTENEKAATCTTDGSYDTVVYCSVCDAELSRETTTVPATGHDYVDGKCDVCGEADPNAPQGPKLDETLKDKVGISMTVGAKVNLRYEIQALKSVYGQYDSLEFEIKKNKLDDDFNFVEGEYDITIFSEEDDFGGFTKAGLYYFEFNNIGLHEMSVPFVGTITLFKDGEAVTYCELDSYTLTKEAQKYYTTNYKKDKTSAATAIATDLLNLGTAFQNYFVQKVGGNCDLADLPLPNVLNAETGETVDQSCASEASSLTDPDDIIQDSAFMGKTSLVVGSTIELRYEFYDSAFKGAENVTITSAYDLKPSGSASYPMSATKLPTEFQQFAKSGMYYYQFDKIALYDVNKLVTTTFTCGDTTRTYQCSVLAMVTSALSGQASVVTPAFDAIARFATGLQANFPDLY